MKNSCSLIFLLLISSVQAEEPRALAEPLTLDACYRLALGRSESVGLSEEDIRRGEAQYAQLRSGVLPSVGLRATDKIQDMSGVPSGANDSVSRRDRPEVALYGRQAIFSGFREFAAMRGQKAEIAARSEAVGRAKILLYEDVAGLFFTVADRDREMESLQYLIRLSQERIAELKKRVAIGRSRESEILSTESQNANLESRLEVARGFREASLAVLNTFMGVQATAIRDDRPEAAAPAPLENYLQKMAQRPEVREAEARQESRRQYIRSARGGYSPTLDVGGNYYLKRVGATEPVDWDILFTLDAPFYNGGKTRSLVDLAKSEERSAALQVSQARREAEGEIRERHRNLLSLLSQVDKLKRSADLAERNYMAQRNDYRLGLVNNLDVLAALNTWQEAQLSLDTARLAAKNVALRLELATGNTPEGNP
ncbi:MAG: TolC family protein [Elusimicrobia bacterium]|nr:TolC family protein [Elusimicrobiota bacterium]